MIEAIYSIAIYGTSQYGIYISPGFRAWNGGTAMPSPFGTPIQFANAPCGVMARVLN